VEHLIAAELFRTGDGEGAGQVDRLVWEGRLTDINKVGAA
jgi:hypothetical protein